MFFLILKKLRRYDDKSLVLFEDIEDISDMKYFFMFLKIKY